MKGENFSTAAVPVLLAAHSHGLSVELTPQHGEEQA